MIVVRDASKLEGKPLVATIGFFDGVHIGHRFLIGEMNRIAKENGLSSAVITFPEHPRAVLQADYQPQLLNSFEEKIVRLATTEVDYCVVMDFNKQLSQLSAHTFIHDILAGRLHVNTLLIGYDHRFGHNRAEGFEDYVRYGQECGMKVIQAPSHLENGKAISSSWIRKRILAGDMSEAARLLTYPYMLNGHIVKGHQVGRTIGFPTANIQIDEPAKIIPATGVYAVRVHLQKKVFKGMLYIGNRPTVDNGDEVSVEVNILDFEGDLYNRNIRIAFVSHVRDNIRFDSLDDLRAQLEKDRQTVLNILA